MLLSRKLMITARVATAIFVSAAVAAGVIIAAPAAYAGTDDYPSQWKNRARDTTFDSWGEYNRECTSWVAWRLHGHNQFEMPFHANADNWGAKAKKLGYTVNMSPAVGSVAWWDTATRSHVAWVEAVYPNNTVEIEEYNIGGSGKYDQQTIPTSSVSGYIHFQDLATSFANGSYVEYAGNIYRMAGGAPIYVSSWASFGKTPAGIVSAKQWQGLSIVPKDGTFIQGATSKHVYEVVGGAPIFISNWAYVGGAKPVVAVPDASIVNAVKTNVVSRYEHLRFYPTGSSLYVTASPSNKVYQLTGNVAIPVPVVATTAPTAPTKTAAATTTTPVPKATPTPTPTAKPTATPTAKPTATPTAKPTATPTATPTAKPTATPTATPTVKPTATPTPTPTTAPTPPTTPVATPKPTITIGDDDIANAGAASTSVYGHLLGYIGLPKPVVTGTVKLKHTLRANLGTWVSKGYTVTYQWYRNGVAVTGSGAHKSTITPKYRANVGMKFTVRVTATRPNFVTQTFTSAPTVAMTR
jgi:surface antigen